MTMIVIIMNEAEDFSTDDLRWKIDGNNDDVECEDNCSDDDIYFGMENREKMRDQVLSSLQ